jgi:hypothetical protein
MTSRICLHCLIILSICVLSIAPAMANEHLSGEDVRSLFVGNTATGTYDVEGVQVAWYEFMAPKLSCSVIQKTWATRVFNNVF